MHLPLLCQRFLLAGFLFLIGFLATVLAQGSRVEKTPQAEQETIDPLRRMARVHVQAEDYAGAEKKYREVLRLQTRRFGSKAWQVTDARLDLQEVETLARLDAKARRELSEADQWMTRALASNEPGKYQEGAELAVKALTIRLRVLGEDHRQSALSAAWAGQFWQRANQFNKSRPYCEQALATYKKVLGDDHPDTADCFDYLGLVDSAQGNYAAAQPYYEQALALRKRVLGDNHPSTLASLNHLGILLYKQGDYAAARAYHEQVLAIHKKVLRDNDPALAESLNILGNTLYLQGEYNAARASHEEALSIRTKALGDSHPLTAQSHNNLAGVLSSLGDFAAARPHYEQALAIRKKELGEHHPETAISLNNLGALLYQQEDYAAARFYYEKALAIRRKVRGNDHNDTATSLNNLGVLLTDQADYAGAQAYFEQALAIRKKVHGETHPQTAFVLNSLGYLLSKQGDTTGAERYFERVLAIRKKMLGDSHPDTAAALDNLARVHLARGDYVKAETLVRQALQIMREQLENASRAQSERQQIAHCQLVDWFMRDYLQATAKLPGSAAATYDQVLSWKGAVTARQRLMRLARTESDRDAHVKELFDQLESVSRQISRSAMRPDALPKGVDLAKKLADLGAERELIEAKLSARTEGFRKHRQSQKLNAAQLQEHLPKGTVLVDFVAYGKDLAAFVITKDKITRIEFGQSKPLADAVDRFRTTMKRTAPTTGKDDPARMLREKLLDPLQPHLAGSMLVLIAPDGPLHALPFAALPGHKDGKYLIEEVLIAIVPVPQMLPDLLAARAHRPADALPSMLALGDVDYDAVPSTPQKGATEEPAWKRRRAGEAMNWARLPGTKSEILAIEDAFIKAIPKGKLSILRDAQATEAEFRKQAPNFEFLHLATHGFFAPKEVKTALKSEDKDDFALRSAEDARQRFVGHHPGLLSGLVLAGANHPKDNDDGVLTALEVAELDLSKVELAVLSACETGLGELAGGEGVLGLQRAFQIAGARTTVTSLWKVDDEATRKLMERFYDNYWRKNMGTLEALREAQLWLLQEGPARGVVRLEEKSAERRAPPYYWAAFVLSGDWR